MSLKNTQEFIDELTAITSIEQWKRTVFKYKITLGDDNKANACEQTAAEQTLEKATDDGSTGLDDPENGYPNYAFYCWLKEYYKEKFCDGYDYCDCFLCSYLKENANGIR